MNIQEAKEIGKIRKAMGNEQKAEQLEKIFETSSVEDLTKMIQHISLKKIERDMPQKVRDISRPEVQKISGETKTEVKNWPDILKVAGEVVAKVAFPPIQKIIGSVTAKIDNFPQIQKIVGIVDSKVTNFPKVQRVEVTNPTEKMYVEGITKVSNLPVGRSDKEGDPEKFMAVRFTDGERYYDLKEMTIAGGGGSAVQYADPDQRWLREDFTYDANNNVTRAVAYDGKGFKKTVDFEYDNDSNMTRKTVRTEEA